MATDCIFCKHVNDPNQVIWKNEYFYARFDRYPVSPGHVNIVPIRHIVDVASLNSNEWNSLQNSIKEVISVIEKTDLKTLYLNLIKNPWSEISIKFCKMALEHPRINTKPDAYNHGINDGKAAGRTIDHMHWHIIPRFIGDIDDPTGGVRNVIPEMGNYKKAR